MKRLSSLFWVFAIAFFFSGCGQSGPLYIPGDPSSMAVPPAENSASEEDPEEEQNDSESSEAN